MSPPPVTLTSPILPACPELVRMMVAYDYKRERRKMIQVTESNLVDEVWHRISGESATPATDPAQPARSD